MASLQPIEGGKSRTRRNTTTGKATTSFIIPVRLLDDVDAEARRLNTSRSAIYITALTEHFRTFDMAAWQSIDEDEYDPTKFYTRSSDKQGHSTHLRVNIPKPLAGEMGELIASAAVPQYRRPEDVVRDAIMHRVKQISRMVDDGKLEQAVDMAMLLAEEEQLVAEAVHAEELIAAMKVNAQRLLSRDSIEQLRKYLAQRRDRIDTIPELYQPEYLEVIADFEQRLPKAKAKPETPKRRRRKT